MLWVAGTAAVLGRWCVRLRRASRIRREAEPRELPPRIAGLSVPVLSSPTVFEPGVFGIFRPVLVLPAGIADRLSLDQLQAVIAHELCHVRRRDNLAAAVHMLVECVFWFHPLVWWMGARLLEERERACDEEVLQLGSDPAVYAGSILGICRFCMESPVLCVSGITGADLKRRISHIMNGQTCRELSSGRKLLLAGLGIAAVAVPLAVGLIHPANLLAQSQTAPALHFTAASFKFADDQGILETRPKRSVGRFRWKTQLLYLLGYAYNMEWWRISDLPGGGNIYELEATTPPHTTEADVRLMLQSLLIERFKMSVHRVTKDAVDGYALSVAKGGPKLKEIKAGDGSDDPALADGSVSAHGPGAGVIEINGRNATMLQFSNELQRLLSTSVLDQTSLTGRYDFDLQFTKGDDPDYFGVISAVKQIGLKLEKYKGPVEFLVIDHIEKMPTGN